MDAWPVSLTTYLQNYCQIYWTSIRATVGVDQRANSGKSNLPNLLTLSVLMDVSVVDQSTA